MPTFVALHQIEIRYTYILDFTQFNKKILSRVSPMANNLGIEKEGTLFESITLGFDQEGYIISSMSDKLIFRYQGLDLKKLTEKNSPIESIFLPVLEKFRELDSFGKITSILAVTTIVDINEEKKEKILDKISKTFLSKDISLPQFNDISITLENKHEGNEKNIVFGPYLGMQDLTRRKIEIYPFIKDLADQMGFMSEIKLYQISSNFAFSSYKDIVRDTLSLKDQVLTKNMLS